MNVARAALVAASAAALLGIGGVRLWQSPTPSPLRSGEPFRIEVRRPREDLVLTREPGGPWVVARQDDVADAESVELLLSGLRSLSFGPPVAAATAGVASGLGPADSARVRVLNSASRPLFDGYFGRRLFGRSAYFRVGDRDEVRVATGVDPELIRRNPSQWREPRLLPGGCAGGLEILKRGAWKTVPAERARELCALRAAHWANGTGETFAGFDMPYLRVRTTDGRGYTVGDLRGQERLVKVEGRSALLRVSGSALEAAAGDLIGSAP